MSTQFGPRGGSNNASTGVARDPAQLVPIQINVNYETELGTARLLAPRQLAWW